MSGKDDFAKIKCNCLDVDKMVKFQTGIMKWNLMRRRMLCHLAEKMRLNDDSTVMTEEARLMTTRTSFCWHGVSL